MNNNVEIGPGRLPGQVDLSDDTTNVHDGAAILHGVFVHTAMSAQACPIEDGSGGTDWISIPASTGAGTWIECGGVHYSTGLFVNPDDSATGKITLVYSTDHEGQVGSGAGLP